MPGNEPLSETPSSTHDLWAWATESNQRSNLFKDAVPTSTKEARAGAGATATPTLTRPINPDEHRKKASFNIGIPIGVSLGILALLAIVLFYLGKKGKLRRFTPYRNPYAKKNKKEEQLQRLEAVEEDRVRRGVVLVGRKEVPIESLGQEGRT